MVANYNFITSFPGSGQVPLNLTNADSLLYFSHQGSLWQTNGTTEQTFELIPADEDLNLDNLGLSAGTNGKLFFNASNNASGSEPWVSDGTTEGTRILRDINPNSSSNPEDFHVLGDTVIFTTSDEATSRDRLWVSDGTTEGTQPIELVAADGSELNPINFADLALEDSHYFSTQGGENSSLWRTDGTQAGTEQVLNLSANGVTSNISNITTVGDRLFFTTSTSDSPGSLWISDGTSDGTNLVFDEFDFNNAEDRGEFVGIGDTLFFTADDGTTGVELWKSDGTPGGTTLVKDINIGEDSSSIADLTVVDEILYFIRNSELWQSDGTEVGTFRIQPASSRPGFVQEEFFDVQDLSEFNDQVYFSARVPSSPTGNSVPALLNLEDINDPVGSPVYRLLNPELGVHIYTIDQVERDSLIDRGYQSEGERDIFIAQEFADGSASFTAVLPTASGSEEVYRFFNETTGGYLYTTNEAERDNVQANSNDFAFQGTAFNVYETQIEDSIPIYRFFNQTTRTHFYTSNEAERESLEADLPNYNFEGVAYYALPADAGFIN